MRLSGFILTKQTAFGRRPSRCVHSWGKIRLWPWAKWGWISNEARHRGTCSCLHFESKCAGNEPSHVVATAEQLADLYGVSLAELTESVSCNAERLFEWSAA